MVLVDKLVAAVISIYERYIMKKSKIAKLHGKEEKLHERTERSMKADKKVHEKIEKAEKKQDKAKAIKPKKVKVAKMKKVMSEFKKGALKSGSKKGPQVKSRKQAIAIGLSEARKAGAKKSKK